MSELDMDLQDAIYEAIDEAIEEEAREAAELTEDAAEEAPEAPVAEIETEAEPEAEAEAEAAEQAEEEAREEDIDDSEDSLTFSNGVIEKIVAIAMRDVPGVVGMKGGWINRIQDAFGAPDTRKGVTVEVTPESAVKVNVSVLIEYGSFAPQVFEDVKKAIVKQVTGMTGLAVAGVNLRIEDVLTAEEVAARNAELAPVSVERALEEGTDA